MKNTRDLQYMTWKEIEEIYKKDPVMIIPVGSMEQHGPHSIVGDFIAAEEVARKTAESSENTYVLPVIPFGYSENFRGFPGTISISPETLKSLLYDVCESLIEHGVTKITIFNGHGGNSTIIDELGKKIRRDKKILISKIDLWRSLSPKFKAELCENPLEEFGHGGEPMTSMMKYLKPDMARPDLLEEYTYDGKWKGYKASGTSKLKFDDYLVHIYFDTKDMDELGAVSNPLNASEEKGEKMINKVTENCKKLVEFLHSIDTRL
ncbi:MAG: creatininase family protein [Marinisporobacter sp.]|jgi:creatinine amidohydrolase|nr:creatininase family protein [Marinisporobacter sp.]